MRYEQLVMKMELPTWWLKFEEEAVDGIILVSLGSILLLGVFMIVVELYSAITTYQRSTSFSGFESVGVMVFGYFAGAGISHTFNFVHPYISYVLEVLTRMGLRLILLAPLLISGLMLQLLLESIVGSWRASFVHLGTATSAGHNGL